MLRRFLTAIAMSVSLAVSGISSAGEPVQPVTSVKSDEPFGEWLYDAKKGHALSQYMVGIYYENGQGVKKSTTKAATWYERAAAQGYSDAEALLGMLYLEGRGVRQNKKLGIKKLTHAAERGNIRGRYQLGVAYFDGKHVKRDRVAAYKWLYLAAYLPRTPESFSAAKKMDALRLVMNKKEIATAVTQADKYIVKR